jgi:hypothetical protein
VAFGSGAGWVGEHGKGQTRAKSQDMTNLHGVPTPSTKRAERRAFGDMGVRQQGAKRWQRARCKDPEASPTNAMPSIAVNRQSRHKELHPPLHVENEEPRARVCPRHDAGINHKQHVHQLLWGGDNGEQAARGRSTGTQQERDRS